MIKGRIELVMILLPIILIFGAHAEPFGINNTYVEEIPFALMELSELDMTGLSTDIEFIEIDPEVMNATQYWIILAHDDSGKKALIEDIDTSSLSDSEKIQMKNAIGSLWEKYPVKFVDAGQKTIEVALQSDESYSIKTIPIGHVTRIEFDREQITGTSLSINTVEGKNLVSIRSSSSIVLTDTDNQTLKNIQHFRSEITSTIIKSEYLGWGGLWQPEYVETNPERAAIGHPSFIYWACRKLNYPFAQDAAGSAMNPDYWTPSNPPIIRPDHTAMFATPYAEFIPFYTNIVHSYDHYWNPDRRNSDGQDVKAGNAPYLMADFASISKQKYTANKNDPNAALTLGWASHFLTDLSNPMHTGKEIEQIWDHQFTPYDTHGKYEEYMLYYSTNNLPYGKDVSGDDYTFNTLIKNDQKVYYRITSPEKAAKNLAIFSHSYLNTLYYKVQNLPPSTDYNGNIVHGTGFEKDATVQRITDNCVSVAARYSAGLVAYVMNKENDLREIPIADFTFNPNPMCDDDFVYFFDNTHKIYSNTSDPMYLTWYFGDGVTETGTYNPRHYYSKSGTYRVKLATWNTVKRTEKTAYITVGECAPAADFSVSSPLPYVISVADKSSYSPTEWRWDFGDGTVSTEQNPNHVYGALRRYTISLTASNQYGSGTRQLEITPVPPSPVAISWISKTTGIAPLSVQFTDQSSGYITSREWDFGDNSTILTEQTVIHEYKKPGSYSAILTIHGNGVSVNTTIITVTSGVIPLPGFTVSPTDPDSDGFYEDLNGNCRADFTDIIVYFNNIEWIAENEPISAFDFNGNSRIDFSDIVQFFNEI